MSYKLKSVKLWLFIALIIFVGILNHGGTVTGEQYIDFIKWIFGFFVASNVASKINIAGGK